MMLSDEKIVNVIFKFDDQSQLDAGSFMMVGRRPYYDPSTGDWAFLMAMDPIPTSDPHWISVNAVDLFVDGAYIGSFSLYSSGLAQRALIECGV